MYLTREQEKMLNGEYGWVYAKALEVIVKVGEALGAEKLIPIKHAHVSGISYTNIGEPGLEFIREFYMSGGKTRVYTTVNPSCIDLAGLSMIISDEPRSKQLELNKYLESMGFRPTYTCIPYLHRRPSCCEHLAWGESSAVIYANSVFGSYTNREGGPLALAAGITGYTYYYGLHIRENRVASVEIILENIDHEYYGALGLWIGEHVKETPYITNPAREYSSLKLLLAAAAATGDHGLIVLNGITPRKTYVLGDKRERIRVDKRELMDYIERISSVSGNILGYIGCPHLDPFEFEHLVSLIAKYEKPLRNRRLLLSIPWIYHRLYRREIELLVRRGVDVAMGTCPIVSILAEKYDYVVTNSGKAAFYLEKLHGLKTIVTTTYNVIKIVYGD